MSNYKCKKIIVAGNQGSAAHTIELGGDVDSGDVTWKHGNEIETPTLEDKASYMWEIWKPGRKIEHEGLNILTTNILNCTAILSDDYGNYRDRINNVEKTLVLGKNCVAIGQANVIGNKEYSGEGLAGPNNCIVIGENNNIFNRNIRNSLICGKGLQSDIATLNNSDSLCILGRYNAYNGNRIIDSYGQDTLVLIGKGTNENNRANVLRLENTNLYLDLDRVRIENCAYGIELHENTVDDDENENSHSLWIKPNVIDFQLAGEVITKIQDNKIKTKYIVAENITAESFNFQIDDNKMNDLSGFFTITGACTVDSLNNFEKCFISGLVTESNNETTFRMYGITQTRYPLGVLKGFKEKNPQVNDEPIVTIAGLCWVSFNGINSAGNFCQIDTQEGRVGQLTDYNPSSSTSPSYNKYWRTLGVKGSGANRMALIQLDQSFSK